MPAYRKAVPYRSTVTFRPLAPIIIILALSASSLVLAKSARAVVTARKAHHA